MFTQINRINSKNETKVSLIKTEDIVRIHEHQSSFTRTYNEDGSVATETENPSKFTLVLADGTHYTIDKTEYDNLVKLLVK